MKGGSCGRFAFGDSRRGFLGTGSFCVGGAWRAFKTSAAALRVPGSDVAEIGRGTGGSARSVIVTMTACVLVPLFVDTVSHAMCRPPRFFMVFGITLFFCYVEGG